MLRDLSSVQKGLIFYAIALAMCAALVPISPSLGEATLLLAMVTPLLSVLLMQLAVTRDGWKRSGWAILGLGKAGWSAWPAAVFLPLVVLGSGYGFVWTTGIAGFRQPTGIASPIDLVLGLVFTMLFAFTEEIGWRGYLLPNLLPLGQGRAMLLSGFLHGLWHLPLLLFTPYYHSIGNPIVVAALFLATLTVAGVVYGHFRLATGSVWPDVIAHGAFNYLWSFYSEMTVAESPEMIEYLAGETGVMPLLVLSAIAGWLYFGRSGRAARSPALQQA